MADDVKTTPSGRLMLEVLAARYRLGEQCWTFEKRVSAVAEKLAVAGLVWWKGGIVEDTIRVFLTDAGKAAALSPDWKPPVAGPSRDELVISLLTVSGNLAGHIETRAREIAAPQIAAIRAETNGHISDIDAAHAHEKDRAAALIEELRRQLAAQCRQVDMLWPDERAWRAVVDFHQPYYTGPKEGQCRGCDEAGIEASSPCRTRKVGDTARAAALGRVKARAVSQ